MLLLRVTIGIEAGVQGAFYLSHGATWTLGVLFSCLPLAMGGTCLLVGFLTPIASILVGIATAGNAMSWLPPPPGNLFDSKLVSFEMIVIAAAVALLGPGAFSVDARLFGRREIVIPARLADPGLDPLLLLRPLPLESGIRNNSGSGSRKTFYCVMFSWLPQGRVTPGFGIDSASQRG